jgi:hypothetical protein
MKKLIILLSLLITACGGGSSKEAEQESNLPQDPPKENILERNTFEYELLPDDVTQRYTGYGVRSQDLIYFMPKVLASSSFSVIAEFYIHDERLDIRLFDLESRTVYKTISINLEDNRGQDQDGTYYTLELNAVSDFEKFDGSISGVDYYGCSGSDCVSTPTKCKYEAFGQGFLSDIELYDCENTSINGSYQGAIWKRDENIFTVGTNGNNAVAIKESINR